MSKQKKNKPLQEEGFCQNDVYRAVHEKAVDGILIATGRGRRIVYANRAARRILGYSKTVLLRMSVSDIMPKHKKIEALGRYQRRVYGNTVEDFHETEVTGKRKQTHYLEITAAKIVYEKKPGIMIIIRDVTPRKIIEKSLRESERRFRDISYSIGDILWEIDTDFKLTYCSIKIKEILGYSPQEVLGKNVFRLMPADELKKLGPILKKRAQKRKGLTDSVIWFLAKNKERRCFLINSKPIMDEDQNLLGFRGVCEDVTEQKKAESKARRLLEKIEKARREWVTTMNNVPLVISLLNKKGEIIRVNRTIEKWGMGAVEAMQGRPFLDLIEGECRAKSGLNAFWNKNWKKILRGRNAKKEFHNAKLNRHYRLQLHPVLDRDRKRAEAAIGIIFDVTDKVEAGQKIFELFRHLGVINRRISILLGIQDPEISGWRDKKEVLDLIVKSAMRIGEVKTCCLYGYDRQEDAFRLLNCRGRGAVWLRKSRKLLKTKNFESLKTLRSTKKRVQIDEGSANAKFLRKTGQANQLLLLPLMDREKIKGCLLLALNNQEGLSTQELEFFEVFRLQVSLMMSQTGFWRR